MSAWLVGLNHIHSLVWGFLEYAPGFIDTSQLLGRDQMGQLLMTECLNSVSHRYRNSNHPSLPGWAEDYNEPYRYARPEPPPTLFELHKNICCYEYQSCEHPPWASSLANDLTHQLLLVVIDRLGLPSDDITNKREWREAPWGWGELQKGGNHDDHQNFRS